MLDAQRILAELNIRAPLISWNISDENDGYLEIRGALRVYGEKLVAILTLEKSINSQTVPCGIGLSEWLVYRFGEEIGKLVMAWRPGCAIDL